MPHSAFLPSVLSQPARRYAQLAAAVGQLFRTKYPNEVLSGPSISWIGCWHTSGALDFLDRALNHSLLANIDAVSVHPYRGGLPETVLTGARPAHRLRPQ